MKYITRKLIFDFGTCCRENGMYRGIHPEFHICGALFLIFVLFILSAPCTVLRAVDSDFPPFWSVERDNPVTGTRCHWRYLGPLGEKVISPGGREETLYAFRPFWSSFDNQENGFSGSDYLWPVSVWRDFPFADFRWILCYYGSREGKGTRRDYLIPLWFSGMKEGEFYWGVFPFYGDLRDVIGYDQTRFILFPLYWQTWKEKSYGEAYLWPIVNWEKSPRHDKFRIFPFYAVNEVYGRSLHQSVLWPLFHWMKSLDGKHPGGGWFFLPLAGHTELDGTEAWTGLWPLFYYQRSPDSFRIHAPWPVFRYGKEADHQRDILFFWPLWGRQRSDEYDFRFYLWPVILHQKDWGETLLTEGVWILPLYWSRGDYRLENGEITGRLMYYRKFWPFLSLYEKGDHFQAVALDLSPMRGFPVVDRNLSMLWRLCSYEENSKGTAWDLLWGILRSFDVRGKDKYFSWSPFYEVRWNVMDRVIRETDGENPDPEITPFRPIEYDVERSFFFGMVKVRSSAVYPTQWKLFWSLEF